jgi:asparagine synthase (glutamine-hydrolysing)
MCGICGGVDLTGTGRADPATVRAMCARIRHRGPDGDGFFSAPNVALGMRRLSIIDVAGSDQPLYNENHRLALVFNGEIYNYRELRSELIKRGHRLSTAGDGETIVHLYEDHGLDLFRWLRGMYAFALWDADHERLLLAVDHIGMKPLYIAQRDGLLWFASEVKALLAVPGGAPQLNLATLETYLSFGYSIDDETVFTGVRRLAPGHVLTLENGKIDQHRYWLFGRGFDDALVEPLAADETAVVERARALLDETVALHLRSDVPLGLFLSGGVDSAGMLALMCRHAEGRVQTFTVGYAMQGGPQVRDNELDAARRIADHFAADHHERVIDAEDWWGAFETYVYHQDEPTANESAISLLLLAEMTAAHVKVVLTGLGGDELFAGYAHHHTLPWIMRMNARWGRALAPVAGAVGALEPYYPAFKRYRLIGALPTYLPRWRQAALPLDEGLRRAHSFDGFVLSDGLRARLYGPELRSAWAAVQHKERAYRAILERSRGRQPFDTAQALVINTWLAGNALLNCDKVTMAHSLEARVPFFDPALLAFAAAVPPALRMRRNKHVLRAALAPLLPAFALERPKQGFSTPIRAWFSTELAQRIQQVLLDRDALTARLFKRQALETLVREHFAGRAPQVELIYRLLTLELWAQRFIEAHRQALPAEQVTLDQSH